jgi:hypothetical protein
MAAARRGLEARVALGAEGGAAESVRDGAGAGSSSTSSSDDGGDGGGRRRGVADATEAAPHARSHDSGRGWGGSGPPSPCGALHAAGASSLEGLEADLTRYGALLAKARAFLQQQRRFVRERQEAILGAQAQWRADHEALEARRASGSSGGGGDGDASAVAAQLRRVKGVLQQQVHELNEETRRLKALKAQVGRVYRPPSSLCVPTLALGLRQLPCSTLPSCTARFLWHVASPFALALFAHCRSRRSRATSLSSRRALRRCGKAGAAARPAAAVRSCPLRRGRAMTKTHGAVGAAAAALSRRAPCMGSRDWTPLAASGPLWRAHCARPAASSTPLCRSQAQPWTAEPPAGQAPPRRPRAGAAPGRRGVRRRAPAWGRTRGILQRRRPQRRPWRRRRLGVSPLLRQGRISSAAAAAEGVARCSSARRGSSSSSSSSSVDGKQAAAGAPAGRRWWVPHLSCAGPGAKASSTTASSVLSPPLASPMPSLDPPMLMRSNPHTRRRRRRRSSWRAGRMSAKWAGPCCGSTPSGSRVSATS